MQIIVGMIGACGVTLLGYYVYILMKGDKQ